MVRILRDHRAVLIGDVLAIAAVTLAGFNTHGTLASAGTRILATFLPLLAAWFLVGLHVGVYDPDGVRSPRQLWRPVWAMILAAPLFGLLRAWFLGASTIVVIFVMVIGGVGALAMLAWRGMYAIWAGRRAAPRNSDG